MCWRAKLANSSPHVCHSHRAAARVACFPKCSTAPSKSNSFRVSQSAKESSRIDRKTCYNINFAIPEILSCFPTDLKKKKKSYNSRRRPCRVCIVNAIRVKYLYRWIVNIFVLTPPPTPFCVPPHAAFSCLHCHMCWCNSYVTDGHVCLSRGGNVSERTSPRWKTDL